MVAVTQRQTADAGFTLLELLIVIAILGLLATVSIVQLSGHLGHARTDSAKLQVEQLSMALDLFRIDIGRLPTTDEGLRALLEAPSNIDNWRGPYLKKVDSTRDPWKRTFIYRQPGEHGEYDLLSYGADGKSGGTGENSDVHNWHASQ